MPLFVDSPTELSTAATDVVLAVVAFACFARLDLTQPGNLYAKLWQAFFISFAAASLLGAVAHAVRMPQQINNTLWHPLYFLLGLTLAILAVIAVCDWRGEPAARKILPWLLLLPFMVVFAAWFGDGEFVYFILFEAVIILFVLGVYTKLAKQGRSGSRLILAGILFSVIAAVAQASGPFVLRVFWLIDHNGVFHLVQLPGVVCFYLAVIARQASSESQPV